MDSPSKSRKGAVCSVNPHPGVLQIQSSHHFRRFIMFDHSNGKGRVFFHSAAMPELFGSVHPMYYQGLAVGTEVVGDGSASNFTARKRMLEGAFSSLQTLGASRQSASLVQEVDAPTSSGIDTSSQKPRVPESMSTNDRKSWNLDVQDLSLPCMASGTLVCEEEPKVLTILPSVEIKRGCMHHNFMGHSISHMVKRSGGRESEVAELSEPMQENTDDLDALLSSDEDDDDDVRSTGHSPEESLGKQDGGNDDEVDDTERNRCKRRKMFDEHDVRITVNAMSDYKELVNNVRHSNDVEHAQSIKRQKIKRIVKALQRILPGGELLNTAFVLDRTIAYVKNLRDRVNQLEATRLQSHRLSHHC